ncbi:hypothetical protein KX729_09445 [Rhizobium sp. XQZ8]|uniref:hypothetical protein n=1 Tax=Rhizobium populisoli TaxID=2859785 RepID=UPI001CA58BE9|nr:hypothetical protein [Rhizobium populisoli]MBW6421664.1 hypothetical protein [Rhizobium populisoli]
MAEARSFRATLINAGPSRTCIAIWPEMQKSPDPSPVAWFSALLLSESFAALQWQASYEYVWSNTGKLFSDKVVSVAQRLAPSGTAPAVRLEQKGTGYQLVPFTPTHEMASDSMVIETSADIPSGGLTVGINIEIAAGIGQPGNAVSVIEAQPNLSYSWTIGETYYAGYGAISPSQYDPSALKLQTPLRLDFGSTGEIVVMLDSRNVLMQLDSAEAAELIASGRFGLCPTFFEPMADN